MKRLLVASLATLMSLGTAASQDPAKFATVVPSGQLMRVGLINPVNPQTCKVPDDLVGSVTRDPREGEVELRREPVTLTTNQCSRVEIMGYALYYRSRTGFVGKDSLVVTFRSEARNTTDVYFLPVEVR